MINKVLFILKSVLNGIQIHMFIQAMCNQGTQQGHNDSYGNYDGWMDGWMDGVKAHRGLCDLSED